MKKILCLTLLLFCQHSSSAQDERMVDSLETILKTVTQDTAKANILFSLSKIYWGVDSAKSMRYADQLLELSEKANYKNGIARAFISKGVINYKMGNYLQALAWDNKGLSVAIVTGDKGLVALSYLNIGNVHNIQGNNPEALKYFFLALKLYEETGDKQGVGFSYNNIGNAYESIGNFDEALKNHICALKAFIALGDKKYISVGYSNVGIDYLNHENYSMALENFFLALEIVQEVGDKIVIAQTYNNIGDIYKVQGNFTEAVKNELKALKIQEQCSDKGGMASTFVSLGNIYIKQHRYNEASELLNKGLTISMDIGVIDHIKEAYLGLVELDHALGNYQQELIHYKKYITIRDSVTNNETTQRMTRLAMQNNYTKIESLAKAEQDKKDAVGLKELQKQKIMRNAFVGGFTIVFLFAGIFFSQRNKIARGKKRSDELLLNILPDEVAEELKAKGAIEAKQFDQVTVMFTDFKDFTSITERLTASELVSEIDACFSEFDKIISNYNVEKIKTIGDSYMCAGGLPLANNTNAVDVLNAGLKIQEFMTNRLQQKAQQHMETFEIRIGVHTGPVVAGIVGVKKFAYDIWGDTVNIASRMESSGEAGKINISGTTYDLVKDLGGVNATKFSCKYRGKIPAKNKGEIDMYFVEAVS
jgi:adenylate cyclase